VFSTGARRNGQFGNGCRGYLGHPFGTTSDWQSRKTEPFPLKMIRESAHRRQMEVRSRGLDCASASAISCRDAGFSPEDGRSVCMLGLYPSRGVPDPTRYGLSPLRCYCPLTLPVAAACCCCLLPHWPRWTTASPLMEQRDRESHGLFFNKFARGLAGATSPIAFFEIDLAQTD